MYRLRLLVLAVGFMTAAAIAGGQEPGTSGVRGQVTDESGGLLPGVAVVVTHQDSGRYRETVSGPDGTYFVSSLVPGVYRVSAELQGFKALVRPNVLLTIGSTITLDLQLQLGGIEETVTVTGESAQIDVTSAQVGGNVRNAELRELPSVNRNYVSFVAMMPGVQYNPSAVGSDSISVNGMDNSRVNFVLDGGNNTDDRSGSSSGSQARAPIDGIQEFQVTTNQYDVEFGRTTGGVVNAVSKQGTNAFRGSGFAYFINSALTTQNIFAKQSGEEEPDTTKYTIGGTLGGPIIKDKAHFFVSYENVRFGVGKTNVFASRPDLNFSDTEGAKEYNLMVRGDHQLNANTSYSLRFLINKQPNRDLIDDTATETALNYEFDTDRTAVFALNRVLGTNKLNTMRISFVSEDIRRGSEPGDHFPLTDVPFSEAPPRLNHLTYFSQRYTNSHHRYSPAWAFDDTFSWFMPGKGGDHDLKFGFQYLWVENNLDEQGSSNGVFTFHDDMDFNAADPNSYPERLQIRVPGPNHQSLHIHSLGFFAQDKWQLRNGLSLSMGVRYDVDLGPVTNRWNPFFDDPSAYPVDWNNIQPRIGFAYNFGGNAVLRGGYGMYFDKMRLGLYEAVDNTGVYVSSGIFNFPTDRADPGPSQGRFPTNPLLVNGPVVNRDLLNQLYPPGQQIRNTGTVYLDRPDRANSKSHQMSIGYERQLGGGTSFAADFIHNWGRDQWLAYELNPGVRTGTGRTDPIVRTDILGIADQLGISRFVSSVLDRANPVGTTQYDGLGLQVERRFAGFWSARASYTLAYSRGITDGSPTAANNFQFLDELNLDKNFGPTNNDRRHNFVTSGLIQVPGTNLNVSALFRFMSGRPLTIQNTNVDPNQNGILFDPVAAGTYSGVGENALTVENEGGRNGAYGPIYVQLDMRFGYRVRMGGVRELDVFAAIFNVTDEPNFANPTGDMRSTSFLVPTALFGGEVTRQLQIGARFTF
jgi:hypothetical protein